MAANGFFSVENLSKNFGGLAAVSDLSFAVKEGEIRGLIGPNGAGKTTVFNLISGFYRPSAGKILYRGGNIAGLKSHQIAKKGVVRTFQGTTLFQEFTVLDNVIVGRYMHTTVSMITGLLGTARANERENEAKALEILSFLGLAERKDELASNLSHGHQRALGIAIGLAAEPKLLMLDEPFAGMNSEETRQMMDHIEKVRQQGITILLVEHDMQAVMGLCDYITVISFGRLLAEGVPAAIRSNKDVIEAYLGKGSHAA
ncbi:MAG TPA: ABC transporter ATP-binding protein [Alphaproteobacteria bacterium]|nr:ABC transporter ATP-binding protein [Alphaproteobacteria bacterium]